MGQIPGASLHGGSASSPRPLDLRFRAARPSDLERLVEIHAAAYPDPRSIAARERAFTRSPFGDLRRVVVVEDRGELVAHAFLHRVRACFGGAWVNVGGIGSVGVAPEARGRGVATALMERLHHLSDRRGDAITALFAFRQRFYARLGYATTSSRKRLGIDPRSIPDAWRALAREHVGALRAGDAGALGRVYGRAAERATGWLRRSRRAWEILAARESRITLVCRDGGEVTGYVAFTLARQDAYGETLLEVDELVALHAEARRALLGALGAMRDQVTEIVLEVAEGDPLERALLDCDARRFGTDAVEHPLGDVVGGPMVRMVDPARAIGARGYLGSGTFEVELEDDGAALRVRVRRGRAVADPVTRSTRAARLVTTRAGLSAVLYGGLRPSDAVALGLARARPEVAAELDAIVTLPPATVLDPF